MFSHVAWGGSPSLSFSFSFLEEEGKIEVDFLGKKGTKCFASSMGPMVFIAKACVSSSWDICMGDFSG